MKDGASMLQLQMAGSVHRCTRCDGTQTVTSSLLSSNASVTRTVLFQPSFQPADSTSPRSRATWNATLHPQVFVRQCRVVKRHECGPGGFERMTKELTVSAPSAMKIKVVAPPDNIVFTLLTPNVSENGSVIPARTPMSPDGEIITVGAKTLPQRGIVPFQLAKSTSLSCSTTTFFLLSSNASVMRKCCSSQAFSQCIRAEVLFHQTKIRCAAILWPSFMR